MPGLLSSQIVAGDEAAVVMVPFVVVEVVVVVVVEVEVEIQVVKEHAMLD